MEIQFLRHATAEDYSLDGGDGGRALNEKGRMQAERVSVYCLKHEFVPDVIATSPLARARETGSIVAAGCKVESLTVENFLACGMGPDEAYAGLAGYAKFDRVMIVGHEPDFSSVISDFIGGSYGTVRVKKASLFGIECAVLPASGKGTLNYAVPCTLMK